MKFERSHGRQGIEGYYLMLTSLLHFKGVETSNFFSLHILMLVSYIKRFPRTLKVEH